MGRLIVNLLVACCGLLIGFLLAEAIVRVALPRNVAMPYGWVRDSPASEVLQVEDLEGVWRNVTVSYEQSGFKRWGDVNAEGRKVLIVGDSFTEMRFVSNGEEWYAYLEDAFPETEFFVHGTGGYGTLQEYMVVDRYADVIQPDAIIWQFYFNDFSNNAFFADRAEYPLNSYGLRPYLEDGEIRYRVPAPLSELRRSRFAELLLQPFDAWQRRQAFDDRNASAEQVYGERYWERDFSEAAIFDGGFQQALDATAGILSLARQRTNATIYLFSADDRLAWAEQAMCEQANITYLPDIADDAGTVVGDDHWNRAGNALVGERLVGYFTAQGWK